MVESLVIGEVCKYVCALLKMETQQCPPLPRGARIGEVPQAEGFGKDQRRCFANLRRKAASRLTVNPFGSQARHFPYIAIGHGDTEEDIAGSGLRLMTWFPNIYCYG